MIASIASALLDLLLLALLGLGATAIEAQAMLLEGWSPS